MTIQFPIKDRFTGKTKFVSEIDCADDTSEGVKKGLAVKWAIKNGADLSRTDLRYCVINGTGFFGNPPSVDLTGADFTTSDLSWSNLSRANLSGANLSVVDLRGATGPNDWIKCIQLETYPIAYTSEVLQIGCERHPISEWAGFDDARILQMGGGKPLKFWRKWKDWIFHTIEMCPAQPTNPT